MRGKVLLVDAHCSVRQMLAECLRRGGVSAIQEAESGLEALRRCSFRSEVLVIFELALPELCGLELLRRLKHSRRNARTLIYAGTSCSDEIRKALAAAPDGFVRKKDSFSTLLEAIKVVGDGGVYLSGSLKELRSSNFDATSRVDLTDRECEVLQLVAESHSSKQIAGILNIAVKTVENHRANLMQKVNAHDVAGLVRVAVHRGMI